MTDLDHNDVGVGASSADEHPSDLTPCGELSIEGALVAEATERKYETAWIEWCAWCDEHNVGHYEAAPSDMHRWVEHLCRQHFAASTIEGRLAAVSWWYERADRPSPAKVRSVRQRIAEHARRRGTPKPPAAPLSLDDLRAIVAAIPAVLGKPPDDLRVIRDRAILTLGWTTARRPSELVGLDVEDLAFIGDYGTSDDGGVLVHVDPSATDQQLAGLVIHVPCSSHLDSCPVRAARLQATQRKNGPLFVGIDRHGNESGKRLRRDSVRSLLQHYVQYALHEDPTWYTSRSLRIGFVAETTRRGVPTRHVARTTDHAMTRGPSQKNSPFADNALHGDWW